MTRAWGTRRTRASAALVLVLGALAAGCGGAPEEPRRTVERYFASLGRDPIRSVPLMSDTFMERHGMHMTERDLAFAWLKKNRMNAPGTGPTLSQEGEAPYTVHDARMAWLALQRRQIFQTVAAGLLVEYLGVAQDGDRAIVTTRVYGEKSPPFVERLTLSRVSPSAPWRIDDIEQDGVVEANEMTAFVANPCEALRRQLWARVGLPPE